MLPVLIALVSAAFFAVGTSMQHHAAGPSTGPRKSGLQMMSRLVRRPGWWLGLALSGVAFALHAVALHWGALALVQPVIVSGIVFAVLARAGLDRRMPSGKDVAWSAVTWVGLGLFILVAHPGPPSKPELGDAAWFLAGSLAVVGLVSAAARRTTVPERRGLLLGGAAGILFGLVAGLVKLALAEATTGPGHVLLHWPLWAMLTVGVWALLLSQRAYHAARLSASMPLLNICDVMIAIAFGSVVFGERLYSSSLSLVVELVGLVLMAIGVRQLAGTEELPFKSAAPELDDASAGRPWGSAR